MCGIAGCLDAAALARSPRETAEAMAAALAARGPDGQGSWESREDRIAFGFRRLAIQDLSPLGDQPMTSGSGRFVAVLNGEIHNFLDLRDDFARSGARFRGRSDTEVMLEAFDRFGVEASLSRFVGMFAIAVWDRHDRELTLVRDRFGVKPLYVGLASRDGALPPDDPLAAWSLANRSLVFASELKALRGFPSLRLELDHASVDLFLRHGYVPAPRTIHPTIRTLPPGCLMRVKRGGDGSFEARTSIWWSLADAAMRGARHRFAGTESEALDELEPLLRDAVRLRLVADVPRGVFLSGGVDSTAVAATAAQAGGELPCFSVAFDDPTYDESARAAETANTLGLRHVVLRMTGRDAAGLVEELPDVFDEPFADSSQLPTRFLCREARREVVVALTGDGGDEVFGGYERHRAVPAIWKAIESMPLSLRRMAGATLRRLPATAVERSLAPLLAALPASLSTARPASRARLLGSLLDAPDAWTLYRRLLTLGPSASPMSIEAPTVSTLLDDDRFMPRPLAADASAPESLSELLMRADLLGYLANDLLVKADRASMASGLELREPLLDHRLVERMFSMPSGFKVRGAATKPLLRRLLEDRLGLRPPVQPKMGFAAPLSSWLEGPLREWASDLLDPSRVAADGLLDPAAIARLRTAAKRGEPRAIDRLWAVLVFLAWRRRWGV
jgi:asparagine synthase (glutamine-hydrolysing)